MVSPRTMLWSILTLWCFLPASHSADFPCAYYSSDCQTCLSEERSALCTFVFTSAAEGNGTSSRFRCADRDAYSASMLTEDFGIHINAQELCM